MKHFLTICLLICISAPAMANNTANLTITGNIKNLKNNSKLFLVIRKNNKTDTVGSAVASNQTFTFRNIKVPYPLEVYYLCIQNEFVKNLELFIADTDTAIQIRGDLKSWPDLSFAGSQTQLDYRYFKTLKQELFNQYFLSKFPEGMAGADSITAYTAIRNRILLEKKPGSLYLPWMFVHEKHPGAHHGVQFPVNLQKEWYERLSPEAKNSYYGKQFRKMLGLPDE